MNNLKSIKTYLKKQNITAHLISKDNEFLNEFVDPKDNVLQKISKFTGSLGYGLIYQNKQYLYVDGRYTEQARVQSKNFIIKSISNLKNDIEKITNKKEKILINPKIFSYSFFKNINLNYFIFFNKNKVLKTKENLFYLNKKYAGELPLEKIKKLTQKIKLKKNEGLIVNCPENIGWLTNIRSKDKKFSKIFNCIALLKNNKVYVFSNQKVDFKINSVIFKKNHEFEKYFSKLKKVFLDKKYTSLYFLNFIKNKNIIYKFINDPIDKLKSIKNSTEITNIKIAHMFDGIAYIKFLYWLKKSQLKKISEIDCQKKIEYFKGKNKFYLGPSFQTIAANEKNASIVHYNPKDHKKNYLKANNLFLFDSGSQYFFGTTDMTRTIPLGKQPTIRKKIYTLVLKSHISVSSYKITKNTTGKILDKIARKNLLKFGYDYNHGTGHGVGYLSNVHETPPSISKFSKEKFNPFQVLSNEPGYYRDKKFGIRLENLIFLNSTNQFENLTLVPFERSMIDISILTKREKSWINEYHNEIYEKIHKFLNNNERKFLKEYCLKIN